MPKDQWAARSHEPIGNRERRCSWSRRAATVERMTIQRMEHVGIVVGDLEAATAFFVELGLKLQGEGQVEGGWVDRVVGLEGVRVEYAMVETPDGHGRLELVKFHSPRSGAARGTRRRTSWASAMSHSLSTTSTPPSPPCEPAAVSSLARWRTTKTSIGSATSAARRGSSSSWRSESADGSGTRRLGDEAYHVARGEEVTRDRCASVRECHPSGFSIRARIAGSASFLILVITSSTRARIGLSTRRCHQCCTAPP